MGWVERPFLGKTFAATGGVMRISQAEYDGRIQFVFYDGQVEIGEIMLRPVAGGYEVTNVLVWPKFKRQGYATKFYRHAWGYAQQHGGKLYRSDDRTDDAKSLHRSFKTHGKEIVFEGSNVYSSLDLGSLRQVLRRHGPEHVTGKSSGFQVQHTDGEYATVIWRNEGSDITNHEDEAVRIAGALNREGYEARTTKPGKMTVIVRKVVPMVGHAGMGPFESMLEGTAVVQEAKWQDPWIEATRIIEMPDPLKRIKEAIADVEKGFADAKKELEGARRSGAGRTVSDDLLNKHIVMPLMLAQRVLASYIKHSEDVMIDCNNRR